MSYCMIVPLLFLFHVLSRKVNVTQRGEYLQVCPLGLTESVSQTNKLVVGGKYGV